MEQAVWLYVGIIAALIGLGFVASIVMSGRETANQQSVENTIRKLEQNCNLVCAADTETMFSVDVTLVAGMKLYSPMEGEKVSKALCADYAAKSYCRECDCSILDKTDPKKRFELDLSEARQLFETHGYTCFMERVETETVKDGVAVECKG